MNISKVWYGTEISTTCHLVIMKNGTKKLFKHRVLPIIADYVV